MKKQYTKVFRHFNQLFEIYYDENGKKHFKEVTKPKLSIYLPDINGKYEYLLDRNILLREKIYNDVKSYVNIVKKYSERGIEYYGYIKPEFQHIYNEYKDQTVLTTPSIAFFDIETGFDKTILNENNDIVIIDGKGFPNVKEANFPIVSITLYILNSKKRIILGLKEYNGKFKDDYIKCDNEKHLLDQFMRIVKNNKIDMLSGWNADVFDYPAIFNRMARLNIDVRKMSNFNILNKKSIRRGKSREIDFEYLMPYDYHFIDFLELYKKMVLVNRESYALNFIADVELGEKKLDYDGDLMELYNNNFEEFIDYNVQDVDLLVNLENKLKLHKTLYSMAYEMNCNFTDIFGTVVPWTAYIYKVTQGMNIILPNDNSSHNDEMKFKGGWVECRQGHYQGILSYDFSALYPSNQITFNISIETLIPDHELPEELLKLRAKYTDGENIDKILKISEEEWKEINSVLKKHNVSMTPNGAFFKLDRQGIVPFILETILKDRKVFKNRMLRLEQLYESIKHHYDNVEDNKSEIIQEDMLLTEEIMVNWDNDEIREFLLTSNKATFIKNLEIMSNYIDYCDIYQLVKKVQANSQYGYSGNQYALLSNLLIAQSITSTGRFMVKWVRDNMNKRFMSKHGFEPFIYADTDSVLGDSKIYIEKHNKDSLLNILTISKKERTSINIEDLYDNTDGQIEVVGKDNFIKHVNGKNLKALSMNSKTKKHEYKPVKYIMKHKVKKKMYRITVDNKSVVVTEDHSIIVMRNSKMVSVKPKEIIKSDKIIYIK